MDADDIVAGLVLFLFGVCGIMLYLVVINVMMRMCSEIVGFRFLISQAITDILLMFQFGIWPGLVIMFQSEILPVEYRWHAHVYLDFTWWAMVYHYTIIAWSRLAAVQWPHWFRQLPHGTCVLICIFGWFAGLVQSMVEHQFEWFQPLFYNPLKYGMDSDWNRYMSEGTMTYYMTCNIVLMTLPFPLYLAALCVLFNRSKKRILDLKSRDRAHSLTPSAYALHRQMSIETRLLAPCIINTLLFVLGQVIIICSSNIQSKWMTWAVMAVFAANSFVNPLLYLCFSSVIRRSVIGDCEKRFSLDAVYNDYEFRSSSQVNGGQRSRRKTTSSDNSAVQKDLLQSV